MRYVLIAVAAALISAAPAAYPESKVPCDTLPAAVLQRAKMHAGDATLTGCVKDKEDGKLTYEVETLRDGKSKDFSLDASGTVIEVEQEITASSLPTAVSDAIAWAAQGGKVGRIESVTRAGVIASYETTIEKSGQKRELAFNPRGVPVKAD
jgi:hypothetical protein